MTVPHYHSYDPKGVYASNGSPERKAKNLSRLIVQLKMLFESPQAYCRYELQKEDGSRFSDADLQAGKPIARSLANYYAANEALHARVDIVLSTAGERHALAVKARNPHAGCFFLTAAQFERWLSRPYYGERTGELSSAFESPATWGLIRTFGVYKSDFSQAAFFEIEHAGARFLGQSLSQEPQKRIKAETFAREGISFSF